MRTRAAPAKRAIRLRPLLSSVLVILDILGQRAMNFKLVLVRHVSTVDTVPTRIITPIGRAAVDIITRLTTVTSSCLARPIHASMAAYAVIPATMLPSHAPATLLTTE